MDVTTFPENLVSFNSQTRRHMIKISWLWSPSKHILWRDSLKTISELNWDCLTHMTVFYPTFKLQSLFTRLPNTTNSSNRIAKFTTYHDAQHTGVPLRETVASKIVNEYDQEIPQSQTADKPVNVCKSLHVRRPTSSPRAVWNPCKINIALN